VHSPALRSWPVLLFVALIAVPPAGLVIIGSNPTLSSFDDASWLFATYFAFAWLLLLGVIVRPTHVTRQLLIVVVVIAMITQIPLAVALEKALNADTTNLLSSVFTVGVPEELAKAIPILIIAAAFRARLSPVDYLFLGAVSGLAFGTSEVVQYITGFVQQQGALSAGAAGLVVLDFVWRFLTDPVSHACWAGITGYFVGLAMSGRYQWYKVGWVGLAIGAVLHGLNDWQSINGHGTWVAVVAVSAILFVAYAKTGTDAAQSVVPAVASAQASAATGQPQATAQPQATGQRADAWWQSPAVARRTMTAATQGPVPAKKKPWWEQ
jgi:RsiW-degrading membrane proteinase PrsW (M82 family)